MAEISYLTSSDLISAVVAAVVGGVSGYLVSYGKKKGELRALREEFDETKRQLEQTTQMTEELKLALATQGAVGKELRDAVRDLTTAMAKALHSMCWLSWSAKEEKMIHEQRIKLYDDEMHEATSFIMGYLAVVAAIDKTAFEELQIYPKKIYDLDVILSQFFVDAKLNNGRFDVNEIENLHKYIVSVTYALPEQISNIVSRSMDRLLQTGKMV